METPQTVSNQDQNGGAAEKQKIGFRVGPISATVWENTFINEDGTSRTARSATIQRRFFNRRTNEWDSSSLTLLNLAELSCVARLLDRLEEAVIEKTGTEQSPF